VFNLGDTLEDQKTDVLRPGARETLPAIQAMRRKGPGSGTSFRFRHA